MATDMTRPQFSLVRFVLGLLLHAFVVFSQDANQVGCQFISALAGGCASAYPGFLNLPFTTQASCLCYYATVWWPERYDTPFTACGSYIQTASPAQFSSLTKAEGPWPTAPCRDAGNVRHYPEMSDEQKKCLDVNAKIAECEIETPGFSTLALTSQASCACYRGNTYIGDSYDASYGSCMHYISTASTSYYSMLVSANGGAPLVTAPCEHAKEVEANPSSSSPGPSSTTSSPAPGGFTSVPAPTSSSTSETPPTASESQGGSSSVDIISSSSSTSTSTDEAPSAVVSSSSSSSSSSSTSAGASSSSEDVVVTDSSASSTPERSSSRAASSASASTRSASLSVPLPPGLTSTATSLSQPSTTPFSGVTTIIPPQNAAAPQSPSLLSGIVWSLLALVFGI